MARAAISNPLLIDLSALIETQKHTIDLRTEEYERTSVQFLKAVKAFTARAREEIVSRKSKHAAEVKRVKEKSTQAESEIQACKVKEIELIQVLEREKEEKREAESVVSDLKRQFASVKEKTAIVDAEIDQYSSEIDSLRREKDNDRKVLESHAAHVAEALRTCESRLQFMLEGVGQDTLLLRFLAIDPADPKKECSIVIDTSDTSYRVPVSSPPIPSLPLLLDQLNETRDLFTFIKDVRQQFVEIATL